MQYNSDGEGLVANSGDDNDEGASKNASRFPSTSGQRGSVGTGQPTLQASFGSAKLSRAARNEFHKYFMLWVVLNKRALNVVADVALVMLLQAVSAPRKYKPHSPTYLRKLIHDYANFLREKRRKHIADVLAASYTKKVWRVAGVFFWQDDP